tara:strand:- start:176 stop:454 length:279 start_codon:yes stop_codon:yes gene_type:complete
VSLGTRLIDTVSTTESNHDRLLGRLLGKGTFLVAGLHFFNQTFDIRRGFFHAVVTANIKSQNLIGFDGISGIGAVGINRGNFFGRGKEKDHG